MEVKNEVSYNATRSVANQVIAQCHGDDAQYEYLVQSLVDKYATVIFALEHYGKTDLHAITTAFLTPIWDALRQTEATPKSANAMYINTLLQKDNQTSLKHLRVAIQLCKLLERAQQQTTCNVKNCICK